MKTIAMIPARIDSVRLPGKLMMDLGGMPIILRTYKNTLNTKLFEKVYVVTDSEIIYDLIKDNGGDVFMSSIQHTCGSDRIAEFVPKIEADLIINIQGDEPFIDKGSLQKLIKVFYNDNLKKIDLGSLMQSIKSDEIKDPNNVKVVVDNENFAIYFSRSIIPFNRSKNNIEYFKHIGVYAFRKQSLIDFYNSEPTPLEKSEKLEQLRYIEKGKKIKMVYTDYKGIGIDVMDDLINARKIINA